MHAHTHTHCDTLVDHQASTGPDEMGCCEIPFGLHASTPRLATVSPCSSERSIEYIYFLGLLDT